MIATTVATRSNIYPGYGQLSVGELQFEVQHIEEVNVFAWIPITDI